MDATSRGDMEATIVRRWYEQNRESWWKRHKPGIIGAGPDRTGEHADEFMMAFIGEVHRVSALPDFGVVNEYYHAYPLPTHKQ